MIASNYINYVKMLVVGALLYLMALSSCSSIIDPHLLYL